MNKQELIESVAKKSDFTQKQSSKAVDAVIATIGDALSSGEKVQLVGFGNFEVRERAERKGRNPQTGEEITIQGGKVPKFKPGKGLKDRIQ